MRRIIMTAHGPVIDPERGPVKEETMVIDDGRRCPSDIQRACDLAAGRIPLSPDETLVTVASARRGERHWDRLAWLPKAGVWEYLEPVSAQEGSRYGQVPTGTLLAEHDYGGWVTAVWLVAPHVRDGKKAELVLCWFSRRDGRLEIKLPDGTRLVRPNPSR